MLIVYFFLSLVSQSTELKALCQKVGVECICWGEGELNYQGVENEKWGRAEELRLCVPFIASVFWFQNSQQKVWVQINPHTAINLRVL